jgi:drug/metabolite transporter (DMT)-like permease
LSLTGLLFILASAFFHVLWNTFLKSSKDKPSAILLMMVITVFAMAGYVLLQGHIQSIFQASIWISALAAGFFFFLYQYLVAQAYTRGDLSQVYPLTITAPLYIAVWSYFLLDEHITWIGTLGIACILYGALSIQMNRLHISLSLVSPQNLKSPGALLAILAAFFYSFGAIADKVGVTVGQVSSYTMALCLCMLGFHLLRMIGQNNLGSAMRELRLHPWIIICGGIVMMLSFITFRIALQDVYASYASALRQVSTVFGLLIAYFVFREPFGLHRVISTLLICAGAMLLKLG